MSATFLTVFRTLGAAALAFATGAIGGTLSPADFQRMSQTAVNLLAVQRHYLGEFEAERPRLWNKETGIWQSDTSAFFFYFDLQYLLPQGNDTVPTQVGDMDGELGKHRLGLNVGYQYRGYSFGLYTFAEGLNVSADRARNPRFAPYFPAPTTREPSSVLAWTNNSLNFAFHLAREGRFQTAVGLVSRLKPLVAADSAGVPTFALQPGDSSEPWRTTSNEVDFFFALNVGGYGFSTLYSAGSMVDLLGFRKSFAFGEGEMMPVFNYFRHQHRYQVGVEAEGMLPLWNLVLGMEAYGDLRRQENRFAAFGHGAGKARIRLWPTAQPSSRRFQVWLGLRGGYSDDALERGVWGHAEGLSMEHLFGILHFRVEHARNDPVTLSLFPVANASQWLFDFKLAW